MKKILIPLVLLLLAGVIFLAGCSQAPSTPATPVPTPPATPTPMPDTIKVVTNPQHGQILVDPNEMTLYYFAKDTPGYGTTACTGACATLWPAFDAPAVMVSSPLQAADFGEFTRSDGQKQTTYRGWPLYYYSGDKAPGDTNGYGIGKIWYVMSPAGVVTLAPTTTVPTTVPTTISYGGGGGGY